jgi:signal peptide peptidase SppA
MRLIDIVNGPWAITLETHQEIRDIYRRHLKGDKIDVKGLGIEKRDPLASASLLAASDGRQVENRGTYTVVDNVAIIPVQDVIAKRMTWFMEICGGCSTQIFARDFAAAQADPSIVGIIVYFDTPGGTVDGTAEAADIMAQSKGNKPCVGFTDGMICSAGYWMAAACDQIFISSDTNPIGSVGVVGAHVDVSKGMEMTGRRVTEITAGNYKRIASSYAPLTQEGRDYIQEQLDHIYTAFTDFICSQRDLSVDDHKDWADGRVFLGSKAIDAGLVDGVSTLDDLIAQISSGKMQPMKPMQQTKPKRSRTGAVQDKTISEEETMTKDELKAKHPELYQSVLEDGKTAADGEISTAVATENGRLISLVSAAFGAEPGDKFAAAAGKGLTADDFKTLGISFAGARASASDADLGSRKEILAALKDGAQKPLKNAVEEGGDDYMSLVKAYQGANKDATLADAMKAVAKDNPEAHSAYVSNANEGRR